MVPRNSGVRRTEKVLVASALVFLSNLHERLKNISDFNVGGFIAAELVLHLGVCGQ